MKHPLRDERRPTGETHYLIAQHHRGSLGWIPIACEAAAVRDQDDVSRIREAIDQTDDAILELIERRLSLAQRMAAAKIGGPDPSPLRPGREAAILARLKGNARSASPGLIDIVWRELIGQGRQAQRPMKLLLFTAGNAPLLEECARRHFSSAIAVAWAQSREAALEGARREPFIAAVDQKSSAAELTELGEIRSSAGLLLGYAYARVTTDE